MLTSGGEFTTPNAYVGLFPCAQHPMPNWAFSPVHNTQLLRGPFPLCTTPNAYVGLFPCVTMKMARTVFSAVLSLIVNLGGKDPSGSHSFRRLTFKIAVLSFRD
jgi:hypothetical protein